MNKTQNLVFKKALVIFMAVIMVFTYMPSMAWADETENGAEASVGLNALNIYDISGEKGEIQPNFSKEILNYTAEINAEQEEVIVETNPAKTDQNISITVKVGEKTYEYDENNLGYTILPLALWDSNNEIKVTIEVKSVNAETGTVYTLTLKKADKLNTKIKKQPEDVSCLDTESCTISLEAASAGALSYQWYENTTNSNEGGTIVNGATDSSFTYYPKEVNAETVKYYYCEVTATSGENSETIKSNAAKVTITPGVLPTVQLKMADGAVIPETGLKYDYGTTEGFATLKAQFSDRKTDDIQIVEEDWEYYRFGRWKSTTKISYTYDEARCGRIDKENHTYTFGTYITESDGIIPFRCKMTFKKGEETKEVVSEPVNVQCVLKEALEPVFNSQPYSGSYKIGENPTGLKVNAYRRGGGTGTVKYQWYVSESADGPFTAVENATTSYYEIETSQTEVTRYYYCEAWDEVTNSEGTFLTSARARSKTAIIAFIDENSNFWEGEGTAESPYLIKTQEDLAKLSEKSNSGRNFEEKYFKMTAPITLPAEWKPIGSVGMAFAGNFDGGNNLLTIPENSLPLFGRTTGNPEISNLEIYGAKIAGFGLINSYQIGVTATISNVTLKSGTQTLKSGFLGGYASGRDEVIIKNCTIEKDVIIGYEGNEDHIGSFAGEFNGTIINCRSSATVKGKDYVGGIVANKGQTMGGYAIKNCVFDGTVQASGNYAGGISGGGYAGTNFGLDTAPNTPCVTIQNCASSGSITGNNYVGGIIGAEPGIVQCWENGIGYIQNNLFTGTVKATAENAYIGGIMGYIMGLDKYNIITNNYFDENCGTKAGIGGASYVDTNCTTVDKSDSRIFYYDTTGKISPDNVPGRKEEKRKDHNRTDDPFGKDAGKLAKAVSTSQLRNGSITKALNEGENSFKNWEQSNTQNIPAIGEKAVAYKLTISGNYKDSYYIGQKFDTTGMTFTADWTDGRKTYPTAEEITFTGFDNTKRNIITVTAAYGAAKTEFKVAVLIEPSGSTEESFKVYLTIYGDKEHDSDSDKTVHTLKDGNLETWLEEKEIPLKLNGTVKDVLKEGIVGTDITLLEKAQTKYGWYLAGVKKGSLELSEFTNGKNSGWMYTVNGKHPEVGGEAYFPKSGDKIVWHYTDDYTREEGSEKWNTPGAVVEEVKDVTTDTKTGTTTAPTEVKVSEKTAADGTKTKVAEVKVSADNQKEVLKQAKASKSKEIILNVSSKSVGDATKADVTLDKSFIDSIVKDTEAKLTIKTPFGDKTYTQDELKAMSEAATGSTVTVAIEKAAEQPTDDTAANIAKAKSIVKNMKLTARSSKTAKKNIKAVLKSDAKVNASIKELKELGFTVKYRFYRSTKKVASYKSTVTKKAATYTNTSGKKGTKYFYKVQVRVYDENGKIVATTALKQCKYASRTWSK